MVEKPREVVIEESIRKILESYNISPFSIVFTYSIKQYSDGLLSITFFLDSEVDELLKILKYKTMSDKSGFIIFKNSNTILLSGMALMKLYYGN